MERSGCTSERKLSALIGKNPKAVHFYRNKGVLPEDETMIRIAQVAGIDPTIALLDLSSWRTDGQARLIYSKILQKITAAGIIGLVLTTLTSSPALAFAGAVALPGILSSVKSIVCFCILWKL